MTNLEFNVENNTNQVERPFVDGDIVASNSGSHIFILKQFLSQTHLSKSGLCYVGCNAYTGQIYEEGKWCFHRHATEKEKQYFFDTLKENGRLDEWNKHKSI